MVISTVFKTHGSVREFVVPICKWFLIFQALNGFFLPISYEIREAGSDRLYISLIHLWSTIHASKLLFFLSCDGQKSFLLFSLFFSFLSFFYPYETTIVKKVTSHLSNLDFPDRLSASLQAGSPSLVWPWRVCFNPRVVVPGGILYTNIIKFYITIYRSFCFSR